MQGLLALYMIHRLLLPGHVESVVGFGGFRHALEAVFGPMTTLALAAQIFGLYTGFVGLTPLVGAWLGDRVLGQRRTTVLGLVLMAVGHLLMASEAAFLFALALLVLGAGFMKANIYAQVGNLYAGGDGRRTRAYSIFLIALNIGAFVAPLVCGPFGEVYGWHWGFGVTGLGMLVGLATYVAGWRRLPPDRRRRDRRAPDRVVARLDSEGWRAVAAMVLMLLPVILIYMAMNRAYDIGIVWAEAHMNRAVFGLTFPGHMAADGRWGDDDRWHRPDHPSLALAGRAGTRARHAAQVCCRRRRDRRSLRRAGGRLATLPIGSSGDRYRVLCAVRP